MRNFFKARLLKEPASQQQFEPQGSNLPPSDHPPVNSFPDGIRVLQDCADATVDICFVHGLTGGRDSTWTAKGQHQPWPLTLLGPRLKSARILTYGYDAYVIRKSVASSNRLIDYSTNLLNDLTTDRASIDNASDRPIIFVAHSLGGLLCKEAIMISRNNPEAHLKKIFNCTKGIIFMGTPHTGSWMADWAKFPASALGIVKSTNKTLLTVLETDNQLLESIQVRFLAMIRDLRESGRRLEVTCFFEELPLPVFGKVVSKESATFAGYNPISVHANHSDMVKFASLEETGFKRLLGELTRWERELHLPLTHEPGLPTESVRASALKTIFAVPFKPDRDFVSRDTLSSLIQEQLEDHQWAVLYGIGGAGKSQLVINHAYHYHQENPQNHVFWIYAATFSRFEQACQRIAQQLHLPGCNDPKTDVCELVARWLDDDENGPWLLIIDNADDAELMFGQVLMERSYDTNETAQKPLIHYLPRVTNQGRQILVTTRNKDVADGLTDHVSPIHVGPLSLVEARSMLQNKAAQKADKASDEVIDQLLNLLAYLPLAITQAAAYVNRNPITMADYLKTFQASEADRLEKLSTELQDYRRERGFPNSVYRTWKLSFDQIRQRDPTAATLLSSLAFLDGQSIPLTLVEHTLDIEGDWVHALGTVIGYSFVTAAADETVSMHSLVQESVRYWLGQQKERGSYIEKVVKLLADSFPSKDYSNWPVCQRLLPHALATVRHQEGHNLQSESRAGILHNIAGFYWAIGQYGAASRHVRESLDIRLALFGDQDLTSLGSLSLMGLVLQDQGKYEQAEEMNRRALKGRETALGVDHPDTLTSVSNLASVLQDQGKYEQAEEMNQRALKGYETVLGVDHPVTLTSVSNLALVLQDQGKYEQAEEMNRRALKGRETALGVDHPTTLTSVSNLALVLRYQGKYEQAEEMNQRALKGSEIALGVDHPATLTSVSNLASVLQYQGKYEQAEEMNRRALKGSETALGVDHPDTLTSVSNLASVLQDQGKYEQAEEMNRRALKGYETAHGVDHPDTLTSVYCLAHLLDKLERDNDALQLYQRAVKGYTKTLGLSHPTTVSCQRRQALLLQRVNQR